MISQTYIHLKRILIGFFFINNYVKIGHVKISKYHILCYGVPHPSPSDWSRMFGPLTESSSEMVINIFEILRDLQVYITCLGWLKFLPVFAKLH